MEKVNLIEMDQDVLGGKPCIVGTRITVEFVLEQLREGYSQQDIMENYNLSREGVLAAIEYARLVVSQYWEENIKVE